MRRSILLPCLACFFATSHLFSQENCDTAKAKIALAHSVQLLESGENQPALDSAVAALNLLRNCAQETALFQSACSHAAGCYRTLSNEFLQKGLFNRAIDFAERSIALQRDMPTALPMNLSEAYLNLSQAHALNGNLLLAVESARKGLSERQSANPEDLGITAFYEQIAADFALLGDTAKARECLNEWESFHRKIDSKVTIQSRIRLATTWAMLFEKKGELRQAVTIIEDTLNHYREPLKKGHSLMVSIAEFHLCELYAQLQDHRKTFEYAEKNILSFENRLKQPRGKLFSKSHYAWYLAQSARAAWNIYTETKDSSWLRIAALRCTQGEEIVYELRDRAPEDGFRDWVANNAGSLTEVRHGLFQQTGDPVHMERAFEVYEASKMFSVQQMLHESQALRWGGLPDSIAAQENAYRNAVNQLETNFFMVRNMPNADSLIAANDQNLFALRDEYRVFLKNLELHYPDYFRLKYSHPHIGLKQVRAELLQPEQCMLDLSKGNGKVFCLVVRHDTIAWIATPFDKDFERALDIVANESSHFPESLNLPESEYLKKIREFADAAHKVYQVIFEPLRPYLSKEVLLIPRDGLSKIPFSALLTQSEVNMAKPQLWHFLNNELVLSQSYSAGFFDFVQRRKPSRSELGSVLAFAPFSLGEISRKIELPVGDISALTRGDFFKPLPSSGQEARIIAELFKGSFFLGQRATKQEFAEESSGYKILHLATHSVVNDVLGEYSFVAFQSGKNPETIDALYARDIYGLNLSADLVVLSACETARGQYRSDEGTVGLTRAFSCAGARNVLASLWRVDDASTKNLMLLFYKEIKKGQPYNRALAQAKRSFIQENRQLAHPYYWAGFVLNGR